MMRHCFAEIRSCANRLVIHIWPPIAMKRDNREIQRVIDGAFDNYDKSVLEWMDKCKGIDVSELETVARDIDTNERRRKDQIESRAAILVSAIAVSTTLLAFALSFGVFQTVNQGFLQTSIIAVLLIAVVHFLCASYYAVCVLRPRIFFEIIAVSIRRILEEDTSMIGKAVLVRRITNCEINAFAINIKSNYLFVAQTLFMRGIVLAGALIVLVMWSKVVG